MAAVGERVDLDPERTWLAAVGATLVALVGGSLAFPRAVYDGFVWHYFWGPVYADAHGAQCAVRSGGESQLLYSASACAGAAEPVAYPGYTLVSEVGYAVTLVVALVGVALLLDRLGIERYRRMFFGLFPFMVFGGALRVVEDVNDAVATQGSRLIEYPLNTLVISPLIYGTVFAVALAALVAGVALDRRDVVSYERFLAGVGTFTVLATVAFLAAMSGASPVVTFHPQVLGVVTVASVAVVAGTWLAVDRFAPRLNDGTRLMGLPVLAGQVVDGVANVVGLDWYTALVPSAPGNLVPKHPVNRLVVDVTGAVLPESVTVVTGTAWPFLLLKVAAALFILWIFNDEVMDEDPRYAVMLLIAAVAVGMGPGTRDALRATFGV